MGRKNRRDEVQAPLSFTPPPLQTPRPLATPRSRVIAQSAQAKREAAEWARAERQRAARSTRAIDWTVCIVPGCGESLVYADIPSHHQTRRDSALDLPICYRHAAVIWHQFLGEFGKRPGFIGAVADVRDALDARDAAEHEREKADHLANTTNGDIYFIRLNGLVKVGWTRNIWQRLKSYGASAELLVNYPASRDDETNLHRQLRPALAKGREWYEDGPIIADFISKALKEYGSPIVEADWTTPKRIVAGKRHR